MPRRPTDSAWPWSPPGPAAPTPLPGLPARGSIPRRRSLSPARSSVPIACSTPKASRSACASSAFRKSTSFPSSGPSPSTPSRSWIPRAIRYHLEKAVYLALSGRPGPVWIDIPLDVQASPIDDPATLRGFDPAELNQPAPGNALQAEVRKVIEALNRASVRCSLPATEFAWPRPTEEFHQLRKLLEHSHCRHLVRGRSGSQR